MSRSAFGPIPSFYGVIFALVGAMAVGFVFAQIGVPPSAALGLSIASVVVVYILWANYMSPYRPVVRRVIVEDVRRMHSARMTPDEIADEARIEPHQVRQILAGDDKWWVKP